MNGVCYNPVRKGANEDNGLITLNPTPEDLVIIEKDFKMMQEAGFNTIRTYRPIIDYRVLSLISKYQLRTIVPLFANYERDKNLNLLLKTVEILKNEPSTLMWEIGNEWNLNHFYTHDFKDTTSSDTLPLKSEKELTNNQCIRIIKHIAKLVRKRDINHPISSVLINSKSIINPTEENGCEFLECIDIYGINVYDWLSFGDRFSQWKEMSQKPFYIGEFGADCYNQNNKEYDPLSQQIADKSVVTEILNNLSAKDPDNILIGGCIFEWTDEWWKDPWGFLDTHDTGGYDAGKYGPYPDHFFTEEWWGLVDIERNTREAYYTIQSLFKGE